MFAELFVILNTIISSIAPKNALFAERRGVIARPIALLTLAMRNAVSAENLLQVGISMIMIAMLFVTYARVSARSVTTYMKMLVMLIAVSAD